MKPRTWLVVVPMVVLAACGEGGDSESGESSSAAAETSAAGDAGSAAPAAPGDPCSRISDAEMTALLPNPVAGQVVNAQTCDYAPTDLSLGRVEVEVFVNDVAAIGCEMYLDVGGFADEASLSWEGAAAAWKAGENQSQLGLCVDESWGVAITLYDPDKTTGGETTARAIGELVLSRL